MSRRLPGSPDGEQCYAISLVRFEAAALFYLAAGFFFVEAAELGTAGGFGGAALLRRMQDGEEHFAELVEARLDVLGLVAVFFAVDDDFAGGGNTARVGGLEALADGGGQAGAVQYVEVQDGFAGDFVDVLSAGTAAAREGEAQLGVGDRDVRADLEVHGSAAVGGRKLGAVRTSVARVGCLYLAENFWRGGKLELPEVGGWYGFVAIYVFVVSLISSEI